MAKKVRAKERRMQSEQKRLQIISDIEQKRLEKEKEEIANQKKLEEQKKRELFEKQVKALETENPKMGEKKSSAKAAGLKSTFVIDNNSLLMTSFGNGNKACAEKYVKNDVITDASDDSKLNVTSSEKKFNISGRFGIDGTTDDPLKSTKENGRDQIFCRKNLEMMYFGKNFTDNIHIQLIYCIHDIEKILAVHVNNIVYELNNLLREDGEQGFDLFTRFGREKTYDKFCSPNPDSKSQLEAYDFFKKLLAHPQMGYFGNTFLPMGADDNNIDLNNESVRQEYYSKCYYLLSVIGIFRQSTAHGDEVERTRIYKFDESFGTEDDNDFKKNLRAELDKLYSERVVQVNKEFLENSYRDIHILCSVLGYNEDRIAELTKDYYRFIILKEYKYLGFSIKRIRETIETYNATELKDKKYNSVRRKLNHLLDFIIYRLYQSDEGQLKAEELVERLRSLKKDSEKEIAYRNEASRVWKEISEIVENRLLPKMDGSYIKSIQEGTQNSEYIQNVALKENAIPFCEAIYLLTIFLDGKEINDLLTQLVNRFDNIQSFLDVMEAEGLDTEFAENYRIFHSSGRIVEELKAINSFARMTGTVAKVKKVMFLEAATVLGYSESDEEIERYIDKLFDQDNRPVLSDGKKENGFRNFIINNVIESDRFKYLVRYGNPKKIRNLAKNDKVIRFVLKDIPDDQIRSYYNSCTRNNCSYEPNMRDYLVGMITGLQFSDFEDVKQRERDNEDKEGKKSLVRLYLTVLYLLQKNLIYINSRYYLAFHSAARDELVYGTDREEKNFKEDWAGFAKRFVEEHPNKKKRVQDYLINNFKNSDTEILNRFRNCTEHLNAVRDADKYVGDIAYINSYFELYHYIIQRYIKDNYGKNESAMKGKTKEYFELVDKYHTYCKDFVKAMNVPFAYNLARYKNLSIDELFDRNNYLPEKSKEWEEEWKETPGEQ